MTLPIPVGEDRANRLLELLSSMSETSSHMPSSAELASVLGCDQKAVLRAIDHLCRSGLIRSYTKGGWGRKVAIVATGRVLSNVRSSLQDTIPIVDVPTPDEQWAARCAARGFLFEDDPRAIGPGNVRFMARRSPESSAGVACYAGVRG